MNCFASRLLIVLPSSVVGGAETLSRTLIRGLRDVEITILTQTSIAGDLANDAVKVIRFDDYGLNAPYDFRPANAWRYARVVATVVNTHSYDAVLAVMHAASIFLALASLTHPSIFANVRCVGSIHGHLGAYLQTLGRSLTITERLSLFLMSSRLHGLVVPSQGCFDDLARRFPRARALARVVYNGVELSRIRRLAHVGMPLTKKEPWVLMPARLSRQKDHATLIRAFSRIADETGSRLILVGDGEERPEIERLANELGIAEKLTVTGHLENPFPWILAADVVVLSSHYEGFGLALVEAMALGRPVVATDCPSGPSEIIRDGIDGFLVSPRDVEGLAKRLSEVLGDQTLRATLGANGVARAAQFSQQKMLRGYQTALFE